MDDIIGLLHSKLSLSAEDGASSNSPSRENKKKRSPPNDQRKESVSKPLAPCTGFPSAFLNNCGTMSIFLEPNVAVDISVNRVIRVSCVGKFSATISNDYNVSLSHELASIHQTDGCIFAAFRAGNVEKEVMIGDVGIVLSMDTLEKSYVLSKSCSKGFVPVERRFFPPMKYDTTLHQFYTAANYGERYLPICHKIVTRAQFTNVGNKKIVILNGFHIRVTCDDNVEITCQNRLMRFSPLTGDVQIKTPLIDVTVDGAGQGSVIKGKKRVQASSSGIVAADGDQVFSIDTSGNVLQQ